MLSLRYAAARLSFIFLFSLKHSCHNKLNKREKVMKQKMSLLFLILYFFFPQAYGEEFNSSNLPQLTVKGEATIFKPADQLEMSVSVVTQDPESKKAVQANNEKMRKVVGQLTDLGLNVQDYQTGHFTIQPIYHYMDSIEKKEASTITHYEVTNTIHIKTSKLSLIEKIIGIAVEAGANQLSQINFNLNNPQAYRQEVIQLATQNAFEDANALAKAANVRLVRVLSLDLDPNQQNYSTPRMLMATKQSSENTYGVPIEIGQVEMRANVHVIFEINQE
ncbi:26 kDa periplasmic immunogenic protein [Candidatus Protochlamydia amoebophila]|uniref:26 kDa periplasmic immunogenic protein n=2 Tax=Candidatus Protochlamydia amoebophila TaxID=362787 RepID=A0A0C1GZJ1_9BACT|nr:26 kDa periplasmic immunogenic protein [Candidatus Protochlamydia amoebophila]